MGNVEKVTNREVMEAIADMKVDKSAGRSGITAEFLKCFVDDLNQLLVDEFNQFVEGFIPQWWKSGIIVLLPKKGDLCELDNWRPISLLNTEWKVFSNIIFFIFFLFFFYFFSRNRSSCPNACICIGDLRQHAVRIPFCTLSGG